ncbi:MAG: arsenate reductase (glutaredoxin) [Parvularculaceae bacterium]
MSVTIWHNPKCSKSRETLALLRARGIEPVVVEYLKTPPSAKEIKAAAKMLGLPLRDLIRKKEAAYFALGLDDDAIAETDLAQRLAENPSLIERPVVFAKGKAAIGRPPEAVLSLF